MNSFTLWIIGALAVLAVATSYLSYNLYADLAVVEAQLVVAEGKLKDKAEEITRLEQSCTISTSISTDFFNEAQESQTRMLDLLNSLNDYSLQELNSAPQLPQGAPADRTTPDLQRLLDAAYCAAATDDPTCTAKQPAATP